jgi:hypothetical protein
MIRTTFRSASGGALRLREVGAALPPTDDPGKPSRPSPEGGSTADSEDVKRRVGNVAISHMIDPPTICPQTAVDRRTGLDSAGPNKIGP